MKIKNERVNPQLVAEVQQALGAPLTQVALIQLLYGQPKVIRCGGEERAAEAGLQMADQHRP